jgi:hypothetical protein
VSLAESGKVASRVEAHFTLDRCCYFVVIPPRPELAQIVAGLGTTKAGTCRSVPRRRCPLGLGRWKVGRPPAPQAQRTPDVPIVT